MDPTKDEMEDEQGFEETKRDLDPDEEDAAAMEKAQRVRNCCYCAGTNPVRLTFVKITQW